MEPRSRVRAALVALTIGAATCTPGWTETFDLSVGYELLFSVMPLEASEIDPGFRDLPAWGHTSNFFLEMTLPHNLSVVMSPGAANFERPDSTQLMFQYNLLSVAWRAPWRVFPFVSAGIGGAIAALSTGDRKLGDVQSGQVLRKTPALWTASAGIGWRIGERWELDLKAREIGFFDAELSHVDSLNVGFSLARSL